MCRINSASNRLLVSPLNYYLIFYRSTKGLVVCFCQKEYPLKLLVPTSLFLLNVLIAVQEPRQSIFLKERVLPLTLIGYSSIFCQGYLHIVDILFLNLNCSGLMTYVTIPQPNRRSMRVKNLLKALPIGIILSSFCFAAYAPQSSMPL